MNAYCNVYFLAIDHTRLTQGDETVSLYASDQHPDLKDQLVKSTFYTGPADRIIPTPEPTPPFRMKSFLRTLFSARWFVFKFGPNTTHGALNISPSKALSEIKRRRLPASAVSATPERDHAAELRANFHLGAQRAGAFNADEMIAGKAEFLKQGLREGSVKFATKIA